MLGPDDAPMCRLGSSRGATDFMPFALSQDVEFFREYVSTERKPRPRAPERPPPPTGLVSRAQVFPAHAQRAARVSAPSLGLECDEF